MSKRRRTGNNLVDTTETVLWTGNTTYTKPLNALSIITPTINTPGSTLTIGDSSKTINFNNSNVTNLSSGLPVGAVIPYAGSSIPSGPFLFCNGNSLAVASYPALFAALGYLFGGSGANFNIPNLMGRVALCVGNNGISNHTIASSGGVESITLDTSNLPSHNHPMYASDTAAGGTEPNGAILCSGQPIYDGSIENQVTFLDGAIGAIGGNNPFNVMTPYLTLNYIIKVQ